MKKWMKNNQGYSLIEIIIVIAIMAVLVGFLIMSISILAGWDAKECAEDMSGHLNNVKTNALSKIGAEMRISKDGVNDEYTIEYVEYKYQDDGEGNLQDDGVGNLVEKDFVTKEYLLSKKDISIICYFNDGTNAIISDVQNVSIGFDRSSGALTQVKVNNITRANVYCTSIEISRGTVTYVVYLIPKTGKISVEKK